MAYMATYNKINPEIFTEIIKNLKLKNNNRIKNILDTTKVIKNHRQSRNL